MVVPRSFDRTACTAAPRVFLERTFSPQALPVDPALFLSAKPMRASILSCHALRTNEAVCPGTPVPKVRLMLSTPSPQPTLQPLQPEPILARFSAPKVPEFRAKKPITTKLHT